MSDACLSKSGKIIGFTYCISLSKIVVTSEMAHIRLLDFRTIFRRFFKFFSNFQLVFPYLDETFLQLNRL